MATFGLLGSWLTRASRTSTSVLSLSCDLTVFGMLPSLGSVALLLSFGHVGDGHAMGTGVSHFVSAVAYGLPLRLEAEPQRDAEVAPG